MPTILITGANRGLGHALLSIYLSRPHHTIAACVRNPQDSTSQSLLTLPNAPGSRVILLELNSESDTAPGTCMQTLQAAHGISRLDTVISNAGIFHTPSRVAELGASTMLQHYRVNAVAPVLLFGAALPLLRACAAGGGSPKFVYISAVLASVSLSWEQRGGGSFGNEAFSAYCMAKAAGNWVMGRAEGENQDVVVRCIHPGWVDTRMGWVGARVLGGDVGPDVGVEESAAGVVREIDVATKGGGEFRAYDGSVLPW